MGGAKRAMMEAEERGYWSHDERMVCRDCILDSDLLSLHDANSSLGDCDFCDRVSVKVTTAVVIQDRIMSSLMASFESIDGAGVPYNSREGGWLVEHMSGDEMVMSEACDAVEYNFLEAIAEGASSSEWVKFDWALMHPYERLSVGWTVFCTTVRHRLRFSFAFESETDEGHPDSTSPMMTLMEISHHIDAYELTRIIPAGTEVIRVRVNTRDKFSGMNAVGAPASEFAKANRMSPAGISMFYGAFDYDTAVKEIWDGVEAAICTKGTFRTKRDIRVVDFTELPPVPGYWSDPGRDRLAIIRFMHDLARDISNPVERNTSVDLHYAPTQVIFEYLFKARHLQISQPGQSAPDEIHGVVFASSHTGKPNLALNVRNSSDQNLGIGHIQEDWLDLVQVEHLPLMP